MIYGSICSGIEAATEAWAPLGWKPSFYSEIDKFPRAVLQYRHPDVSLHGDFTTIEKDQYEAIDVLVGGTPCQSFSVAGLRAGLDDDRGKLSLEFIKLAEKLRPRIIVWENVAGVLSNDNGRAFASFLGGLAQCGYGFAYRVLNAQYFGVPQRRRRVFVIGYFGDWKCAAKILFEPEGLLRDIETRQDTRKGIAGALTARTKGGGGLGTDFECSGGLIPQIAGTLTARDHKGIDNICLEEGKYAFGIPGNWIGRKPENGGNQVEPFDNASPCLTKTDVHAVCYPIDSMSVLGRPSGDKNPRMGMGIGKDGGPQNAITKGHHHAVAFETERLGAMQVRRLTPVECERLQGFKDNYTRIPWNGKPPEDCPDGPRYKCVGNSMAVPVMHWLGQRIERFAEDDGLGIL